MAQLNLDASTVKPFHPPTDIEDQPRDTSRKWSPLQHDIFNFVEHGQGNAIVERLKPKIVIPTHYLNETTTYTLSTLQSADEWVKQQKSFKLLDGPSLALAAADVAKMDREFLYFGNHAQTA